MNHVLSLGAFNKLTGEYVYPKIANKKDEYVCPECDKDLILCKGEIRLHHFRHKVDSVNPCNNYNNPGETQIHRDAKLLMKSLLERKIPISFVRNCASCKKNEEFEITEISETSKILLEHRFEFNGPKTADVAYIDNNELVCVFEICNTHKTCSQNRPEPWFEINAEPLIQMANSTSLSQMRIPCIRCEKCEDCVNIENSNLNQYNIEKYIRIKLGQKIFPTPEYYNIDCKNLKTREHFNRYRKNLKLGCSYNNYGCIKHIECNYSNYANNHCEECSNCEEYNNWYRNIWKKEGHLRFNFDAQYEFYNNKKIIDLFSKDFVNKKCVIHTWKGGAFAYVISKLNYNKYNYWEKICCDEMQFPFEKSIDFSGSSTVEIIKNLIRYCENTSFTKKIHRQNI